MPEEPDFKSLSILTRDAFDRFVNGEPGPWRRCVATWQDNKRLPDWRAHQAIQNFLDSSHDEEIEGIEMKDGSLKVRFWQQATLRLTGVSAWAIEPSDENETMALLYGEVFCIGNQTFTHLLCDVADLYALHETAELLPSRAQKGRRARSQKDRHH
jgi:hypothetical protein